MGNGAHSFEFEGWENVEGLISRSEVQDFVEMFYRWEGTKFTFFGASTPADLRKKFNDKRIKTGLRGECRIFMPERRIHITLVDSTIRNGFTSKTQLGGNLLAPTLNVGAAMVLAHELEHANQFRTHKPTSGFFNEHRYINKASEREARRFADEKLREICAYFSVPYEVAAARVDPEEEESEIDGVISLLSECTEVTMDDVREELRASRILNPANVQEVVRRLKDEGIVVGPQQR